MTATLLGGALLGLIEEAGYCIATLTEGLDRQELLRSRLTRAEVQRQLQQLVCSADALPDALRLAMPEIDWAGLRALGQPLARPAGQALDDALWFAVESLVPATLLWLRIYRKGNAGMFQMTL